MEFYIWLFVVKKLATSYSETQEIFEKMDKQEQEKLVSAVWRNELKSIFKSIFKI